jgi:hypothetical protein
MESIRIFAYGSLLKETSLRKTVPDAKDIYPAQIFWFQKGLQPCIALPILRDKQGTGLCTQPRAAGAGVGNERDLLRDGSNFD